MPLPGGDADKAGNRYELRWTVRQFIRLLRDEVVWIELEPIGEEGDRIEFRLCRSDGRIEAHQVKRQQSGKAHWTIADLTRANVLEGLRKHALDKDAEFVFVSTQPTKSLPELRDRAQTITDFSAFQESLSLDLKGDFDLLQRGLGVASGEETWRAVRQSRWIPGDERELGDTVLALLGAYLTEDPEAALGVLAMFALEAVHRRVTAAELWEVLAQRGIEPSDVARDQNLAARLRQCQEDYLESQEFGIGNLALPRQEADQAVEILLDPAAKTRSVFLVGPAGMGKTGATGQIVHRIAQTGWPLLPFRLDRLDPTQRPAEIGRQLLGREKSPVAILAGLAAGGDSLLVIEQLDAVSVVSGRRPEVFDAVASLVREARAHTNMRLLLVCRAFDLENDARLRDLLEQEKTRATTISVGPLDQEQVKQVVAYLDIPPEQFTPSQVELLRLPLHLALLAGVTTRDDHGPFRFSSAKDLYDAFWLRKRSDLLQVLSDQNAFEILLYALCEAMNERQTLSVPRGCLPPGDADLDRLVSANVCARQGSRIGFFHEGFFDYVFARRFSEKGEPLLELLRSAEQDLFRRSQVRQILAYRRDEDFDTYLEDLGDCLAAPDVRFHIKKLMIGVVGQVTVPRPEEWGILEGQLGEQTARPTDPVRAALWSSAPWFRFLHDQGVLTGWLASERPETMNFAFNWLRNIAESEPDRVADLLEGQAGASPERDERILGVLCWYEAAANAERLEALFHRLATEPERDWAFICGAFKTYIHNHCYDRSGGVDAACRAVGRWLEVVTHADSGPELFSHDRETQKVLSEHDLAELVKKAPEAFMNAATAPWLKLLERAADRDSDPPYDDRIWRGGFRELTHWVPEALIISLVAALKGTVASSPTPFRSAIDQLSASECQTAHAVLIRALVIEDGTWKSVAIDYLAESWTRWDIWYDDQARWDCGELLKTLSPFLDEADVARMEPWLLTDFERWQPPGVDEAMQDRAAIRERARCFRWSYGQHQYELLRVLPTNLLSEAARWRQGELARKAASLDWKLDAPQAMRGGWVRSPLPDSAAKWMTDAQWLSAIRKYGDDKERVWLRDRVLGGARQLAGALGERTKEEPGRFARLMLKLPDDANEHYFEAVVMGLQEGDVSPVLLRQVIERAHGRPGRPHGRWLPRVIASHGHQEFPSALLDVISWYATEAPDPVEERWQQDAGGNYGGDPYGHGINTARGCGARAIARLIARDQRYWEHFMPVLERMVADPSIAVRTCVAEACTQVLRYDRATAVVLFQRLCDAEDDLLGAHPVEGFLHYTARAELDQVWPILERMLASSVAKARKAGARQATLAALSEEAARPLAETAMNGDSETRKGAAEVLSRNVFVAPDRAYCEASLIHLFDDSDPELRAAAGNWTQYARDENRIEPALSVVQSFVESLAFAENAESFFRAIEEVVDAPPGLLLKAGRRFLDRVGSKAGDLGQSYAAAGSLSKLILRAYRQAELDPDLRRQILDLFDRLLEVGGYGADEAIEAFNR